MAILRLASNRLRTRVSACALLLVPAATLGLGCIEPELEPDPGDDPPATAEGSHGQITVHTPEGDRTLGYVVSDGHAFHSDLDLGPVEDLFLRGGAANLGERWPDNTVQWAFDQNMFGSVCQSGGVSCVDIRTSVRATLANLALKIPIRFLEVSPNDPVSKVILTFGPNDADYNGHVTHTGWADEPDQRIHFKSGHLADGNPVGGYHLEPTGGTLRHEMLHILGMWHEHQRFHRADYVDVHSECIIGGEDDGDFTIREESADVGLYDLGSIMHYQVGQKCLKDPITTNCVCPTMTVKGPGTINNNAAGALGGLSVEDTNTLHQMYAPGGIQRAGQKFGASMAVGDFDADGYDDLAVGAPSTKLMDGSGGWLLAAGTVTLYKGTIDGPVYWRTFKQNDFPNEPTTARAELGAAVAAYDLDADGVDDLAIGAPGLNAGAVFVWRGTRNRGFASHRKLTQTSTGVDVETTGDRFGAALAGGPMTSMTRPECSVPAIAYETLAVGAPNNLNADGQKSGAVFLYQERASGCGPATSWQLGKGTKLTHVEHQLAKPGDGFGSVLAIGVIGSGDSLGDLYVGAPLNTTARGAVYKYLGRTPPESNPVMWTALATYWAHIAGTKDGDELGGALAIGQVKPGGTNELVVGAPGNGGAVSIFGDFALPAITTITHPSPSSTDRFGAAVAVGSIGDPGLSSELAIGIPGRSSGVGQVMIVDPAPVPVAGALINQSAGTDSLLLDLQAGDRFGSTIAIGEFDGTSYRKTTGETGVRRGDLAIGALGETMELLGGDYVGSGVVEMVRGATGASNHNPWNRVLAPGIPYRL